MKKIITNSEKETFEIAKNLAKILKGGEIIALIGNLGAGKTVFSKGLASGLGIKENVTSPTFTIMKVYNLPILRIKSRKKPTARLFCHIDAYRVNKEDLVFIGALDYFNRKDSLILIEWADKVKEILPNNAKIVKIIHLGENKREITLS